MVPPDRLSGRLGNRMFQLAYMYAQIKDGKIPDWYVQDPQYFEKYEKDIKDLFGEGIGFLPFVGIHVRRGGNPINPDEPKYSENPFYVDLTKTDYYQRAMAMFPGENFLVFSDDTEFCKEFFKGYKNLQVVEGGTELEDFNQLASCEKGIIMANSSYSWWCSFLNPSPIAKIIAPKAWYSDGNNERTKLPNKWIRI